MDLRDRPEAVSIDLTKRSEDQRHAAVNQPECGIGENRSGDDCVDGTLTLQGKGRPSPRGCSIGCESEAGCESGQAQGLPPREPNL